MYLLIKARYQLEATAVSIYDTVIPEINACLKKCELDKNDDIFNNANHIVIPSLYKSPID